jgi:hypothetical protein
MDTPTILGLLEDAKESNQFTNLTFDEVTFDAALASGVVDLLRYNAKIWERIDFEFCEGLVDVVVSAALTLEYVRRMFLASDAGQERLLVQMGALLRINRSLTSLWLLVPLTKYGARALGGGLGHNQVLSKLSLSGSQWDEKASYEFARGIESNETLRILDLSCCYLDDATASTLVAGVQHSTSLEYLDLSSNLCRTETMQAISKLLLFQETNIRTLDLREQNVEGDDSLEITSLCQTLTTNDTLKKLKLSKNNLSDTQVVELANSLVGNSTLSELDLQWNKITDRGVNLLKASLPEISGLQVLLLGGNEFGKDGQHLLESLEEDDDSICTINEGGTVNEGGFNGNESWQTNYSFAVGQLGKKTYVDPNQKNAGGAANSYN